MRLRHKQTRHTPIALAFIVATSALSGGRQDRARRRGHRRRPGPAVTRQDAAGNPIAGWYPEQEMSLKEAFRCFTLDAAYAGHQENTLGSLEAGKYADFIVIDRDMFKISPYDIHKIGVLETWVGGRQVWKKN